MPRYSMQSDPDCLVFVIPSRFKLVVFILVPGVAIVFLLALFHPSASQPLDVYTRIEFGAFVLAGTVLWLWTMFGKEELQFTPTQLTRRRSLLGISRTDAFQIAEIRLPHFVVEHPGRKGRPSGIGFQYRGKTLRIATGVRQLEAKEIVETVVAKFPEMKPTWGHYIEGVFDSDRLKA